MIPEIIKTNLQEYFEKKFGLLNNIIGDSENIKDCKTSKKIENVYMRRKLLYRFIPILAL